MIFFFLYCLFIVILLLHTFSHPVSEEEECCRKHGDDEDDHHDVDESSSHEVHIAHEISDHDIYGGPERIAQKHEEGDVQEIYIRKASDERSKGPGYGNKPRNEKGPSSFVGEEVMDLVKILFVDELKKRTVFKTTSMVLFPQILTNFEVQHITKERSHIEAHQQRNHIEVIC